MLLILFFILALNIVAIGLTYYCLGSLEKKEKIIFLAIGIAVIYMLTSLVYWISTKDIAIKEVSEMGKNLITLLFVPVNSIIVLPILAKSYAKYKIGTLALNNLKNRGLVLVMLLAIILIIECIYFKDIQNSVVATIERNKQIEQEKEQERYDITNYLQSEQTSGQTNTQEDIETINGVQENVVSSNTIVSTVTNETGNNIQTSNQINDNQSSSNRVEANTNVIINSAE